MNTENDLDKQIKYYNSKQVVTIILGAAVIASAVAGVYLLPLALKPTISVVAGIITIRAVEQSMKFQGAKATYRLLKENLNAPQEMEKITNRLKTLQRHSKIANRVKKIGLGLVAGGMATIFAVVTIPALGFLAPLASPLLIAGGIPFLAGSIYKCKSDQSKKILTEEILEQGPKTTGKTPSEKPSSGLTQKSADKSFNPKASPEQNNTPKGKQDVNPIADKTNQPKRK